jgi:hypothetical protein
MINEILGGVWFKCPQLQNSAGKDYFAKDDFLLLSVIFL